MPNEAFTEPWPTSVWGSEFPAWRGATEADAWISAYLGTRLRFMWIGAATTRRVKTDTAVPLSFADGYPLLLIGHAVHTRLAWEAYRLPPEYTSVVWSLWMSDAEGRQLALLVPGWLHGCLGVNFAFGRRAWYQRVRPALFAVALLLPVLGGLGFLAMGKELAGDEDAVWEGIGEKYAASFGRIEGRKVIRAMFAKYMTEPAHFAINVHFLTSELIDVAGSSTATGSWVMLQTSTFATGASHLNAARLTVDFRRGKADVWRMDHFRTENLFSRPVDAWNKADPLPVPD